MTIPSLMPVSYLSSTDIDVLYNFLTTSPTTPKISSTCPFKKGDRVRVLSEHDGNTSAIGQIGTVTTVEKALSCWIVAVKLIDVKGQFFGVGSSYFWRFPYTKLVLVPFSDGLDNWE